MSKTPRTDAGLIMVEIRTPLYGAILTSQKGVVDASFARQLETELADARAEIERKDKLIEQLKLALKTLRKYPHTYKMTGQGCIVTDKDLEQCDAALLAAEGGE